MKKSLNSKSEPPKTPISFRLRTDIVKRLKAESDRLGYEQTAFVEGALDEALSRVIARLESERLKLIQKGPLGPFKFPLAPLISKAAVAA